MIISQPEAKKLTERILGLSKADSCAVSVTGHERGHIRLALNSVTTSGLQDNLSVSITSNIGKRSGAVTINQLGDASIASAVKKSEEIARLAPEDPEFQEPLGPEKYLESKVFFESTAQARPEKLAALARPLVDEGIAQKVTAAGFLQAGTQCSALATSKGLFVYEKSTDALCTVSARTSDGTGSGWAGGNQHDIARLQTEPMGKAAAKKAFDSRNPTGLEPGKYTVILEPSAVCDLVALMIGHFDVRNADEGRSFFSKKGGGNKLGEKVCGNKINVYSDPHHELTPGSIYSTDGLPAIPRHWIQDGTVGELITSRFWAQKSNRPPVPQPTNLVMTGGTTSLEEMIQNTKRGVLVTRFWYIREVDPRTLLFTGLTRDGTFLIENGKIARPIKNFRFNESVMTMLNQIEAMGPSVRAVGSEADDWSVCVPRLLVRDFTFSSVSDAV